MTKTLLLVALVIVACLGPAFAARKAEDAGARVSDFNPPDWYHKKDGPIYDIFETSDDVEKRRYYPSFWVTTNVTNLKFDDAYKEGTRRLDEYWAGQNVPSAKIDSTVPTFTMLYPSGTGRSFQATFTLEYFLPHELHANPPAPKATDVTVQKIPDQTVWVKIFGGYAREDQVIDEVFDFFEDLKNKGVNVETSYVGLAIYDDPIRVVNRHNEIWVWEKEQPTVARAIPSFLDRVKEMLAMWN